MDVSKRQITKIAREVNKLILLTVRASGIGTGDFDLIHLVRHEPGSSQKEISRRLNIDKGAVARRVASLEQKGYLIREGNPVDGRSRLLYATDKADTFKNSRATAEAVFYEWLMKELPQPDKKEFPWILELLYMRSQAESRNGFPHVTRRLEISKPGKFPEGEED